MSAFQRARVRPHATAAQVSAVSAPSVAVVVVAYNAAADLPACLDSLAALDYPRERVTTLVVDNGSTDDTGELLAARYPDVTVLRQERNVGFAEANNLAARSASADCLALVNADMRVDPAWLRELTALYDPATRICCVASLILDWDGRHVDFAGSTLNFTGHGNQLGHGRPVAEVALHDGADLLFACGGAMLIDRAAFVDAGGFDPAYFIYFEDVDLGWRLRLLGYRTRLAMRAVAYHRGHATTSAFRAAQVRLLYERNALRTLIKNLDEQNLERILGASLLLLAERARLDAGSERSAFELGGEAQETEVVRRLGLAPLHAVGDVIDELDELLERRREIQRRRRVGDDEVFALFERPFQPAGRDDDPYLRAADTVARAFRLEELFTRRRATRVLVASGRGRESAIELARLVSAAAPTTLASPREASADGAAFETAAYDSRADLVRLAREADVVFLDAEALAHVEAVAATGALVAVDLASAPPAAVNRALGLDPALVEAVDAFVVDPATRFAVDGPLSAAGARMVGRTLEPASAASAPTLLTLIEEPWRWRALRADRAARTPSRPTEPAQILLGRLRRAAAARAAAHPPPPPLRVRARRRARRQGAELVGAVAARTRRKAGPSPDRAPTFRCNVCAAVCPVTPHTFEREVPSCSTCGSTSRFRAIVHVLSTELFGRSVPLPDFPRRRDLKGLGMSDWEGYAERLAAKFDYLNTFYHREPRLDIRDVPPELEGQFDFVICSEVLEHVPPPTSVAFRGLRRLLRPTGVAVVTTPWGTQEDTIEHFPELYDYELVELDGRTVLRNVTRSGEEQVFEDLRFHGGDGDTLELRYFSVHELLTGLTNDGFAETVIYRDPFPAHGVGWAEPWGFPLAARAARGRPAESTT